MSKNSLFERKWRKKQEEIKAAAAYISEGHPFSVSMRTDALAHLYLLRLHSACCLAFLRVGAAYLRPTKLLPSGYLRAIMCTSFVIEIVEVKVCTIIGDETG